MCRGISTFVVIDANENVSLAFYLLLDPSLLLFLLLLHSLRFFFYLTIQSLKACEFICCFASVVVVGWWVEGRDVTGLWNTVAQVFHAALVVVVGRQYHSADAVRISFVDDVGTFPLDVVSITIQVLTFHPRTAATNSFCQI